MTTKHQWLKIASVSLGAALLVGCASTSEFTQEKGRIIVKPFGQAPDGSNVNLYTLRNAKGAEAGICNYGGLVIFLKVPDRNGKFTDVVLGYQTLIDVPNDQIRIGLRVKAIWDESGTASRDNPRAEGVVQIERRFA